MRKMPYMTHDVFIYIYKKKIFGHHILKALTCEDNLPTFFNALYDFFFFFFLDYKRLTLQPFSYIF